MSKALLHIEELPGEQLNLKIKNGSACSRLIRNAMDENPEVKAMILIAAVNYMEDKKLKYSYVKGVYRK